LGRKEEHLTYGGRYFAVGNGHTAAFVVSFTTTVMLRRVYTYRCGEAMPAALAAVENQLNTVRGVRHPDELPSPPAEA